MGGGKPEMHREQRALHADSRNKEHIGQKQLLRRPVSRRCCEPVKIQHPALSVDKPYSQQEKEHARNVGQQINQAVINGTALPFEHDQDTAADGGYLDGNINVKKIPGKKDEHD